MVMLGDEMVHSAKLGWGIDRRQEGVGLDLEDYDPETGRLVVSGKGRKERTVYLNDGTTEALADWLAVRGEEPGALFWPIRKGGHLESRRLKSTQAVYSDLKRRATEAGVKDFSPHDLRRTFVSDLLDAGADIAVISRMAGHAYLDTTARYDRRPEEAKRKAAKLLHIPYRRRPQAQESQ